MHVQEKGKGEKKSRGNRRRTKKFYHNTYNDNDNINVNTTPKIIIVRMIKINKNALGVERTNVVLVHDFGEAVLVRHIDELKFCYAVSENFDSILLFCLSFPFNRN